MNEFIQFLQSIVTNLNVIARLLGIILIFVCGGGLIAGGGHAMVKFGGAVAGVFLMIFAPQIVAFIGGGH